MRLPRSIYLAWLRLSWLLRRTLGIKTYGIGWTAARVGEAFDFEFLGRPFRFLPGAARSYCLLPAGIANEPETHQFLQQVLDAVRPGEKIAFVESGASVGEFVIPMAWHSRVEKVWAFEPHPATAEALRASAALAPAGKIDVIQQGVSSISGCAEFDLSEAAPTSAGLRGLRDHLNAPRVHLCTLDEALQVSPDQSLVILIDIEGGELNALRGGSGLIARLHPLIIFEYNGTTRQHFQLSALIINPAKT